MSSTASAEGAHPYFQEIETVFVALRGAPLLLAPADWHVAKSWHEQGIPLRLVERVLSEIFERRRKKEGEDGKKRILTLRYCRRAVERAWKRQRELLAPASSEEPPAMDVGARLANLAAALPTDLPGRERVTERLRDLTGEAEAIEDRLAVLDRELLEAVRERLHEGRRTEFEARLEASLAPLRERLPRAALERAEGLLQEQILRQMLSLPVLSLFSPAAEGRGRDQG